jgi:hypothetical protein
MKYQKCLSELTQTKAFNVFAAFKTAKLDYMGQLER